MIALYPFTAGPRHGQVAASFSAARFLPGCNFAGDGAKPTGESSPAAFSPGKNHLSRRGQARDIHARRFQLLRDALAYLSSSLTPSVREDKTTNTERVDEKELQGLSTHVFA